MLASPLAAVTDVAAFLGPSLALAAIVLSELRYRQLQSRRPRLTLSMDPAPAPGDPFRSDYYDFVEVTAGLGTSRHVRLRVGNLLGKATAKDVQVLASTPPRAAGQRPGLDTRALVWSSAEPKEGHTTVAVSIPAGVERHVELAFIEQTPGNVDAKLWVHPEPEGGGHRIDDGERVEVHLIVCAEDLDAEAYTVTLERAGTCLVPLGRPTPIDARTLTR